MTKKNKPVVMNDKDIKEIAFRARWMGLAESYQLQEVCKLLEVQSRRAQIKLVR